MKTIAICNHKGGVGKTALSMAIAEGLHRKGKRTLLVDLDQQMNATQQAKIDTTDEVTVYDLLTSFDYTAKDGIKHFDGGDIIPGDVLVSNAESDMAKLDTRLTMLADAMEGIDDDYDYAIIDCPPSLGLVTRNAMVAADELIVPVIPNRSSLKGFTNIQKCVNSVRRNKRLNPNLRMLDIDENTSVEDDMFENVKTDEDMDHEMEEEEGGSAFEEEIDPDESDQQEQAVIPKSQTPFLSDKDTPESYGELIGFMEKFIEDQKAENDAFRKEVKDSLSSTATDFKQRTDLILDEMKSIQSDMKREASATRRAQNSLSKMVASFEQGDKYAETVTKAVTDGATQAVEETVQAGTKAINEVAKKSAKSIEKLEQAANARAKRFMRITKPEVMVNIAIWIAVAVASAIILSFCYEFFTK